MSAPSTRNRLPVTLPAAPRKLRTGLRLMDGQPSDPAKRSSSSRTRRVVASTLSGLRLIESMPISTRNSAISGIVRRRLAAEPGVDAVAPAAFDRPADHLLDPGVALVVVEGHHGAVAVHPEGELGEVVRADREAVEPLGELVDQDRRCSGSRTSRRSSSPFSPAPQTELGHRLEDQVGLLQPADEREHQDDVRRVPSPRGRGAWPGTPARIPRRRPGGRSARRRGSRSSGSPREARSPLRRAGWRTRWS